MEVVKKKWYKTTGGVIAILAATATAITGIVYAVRRNREAEKPAASPSELTKAVVSAAEKLSQEESLTPNESLPPGKCDGPVRTDFDRLFNYVKCDGVWWTISKDKTKISAWKSLAENKTATNLLNNKYPN